MIKKLVGKWHLKSFYINTPDGSKNEWRPGAHGTLIYTPDGDMSVSINSEIKENELADKTKMFDSILFYSGKYHLDDGLLVHEVENSSDVSRIGQKLVREFSFIDQNKMQIIGRGDFGTAVLVWEKL